MEYELILNGSPIIPTEIFVIYAIALTVIFLIVTLNKKGLKKSLLFSIIVFHVLLLTTIFSFSIFMLYPSPRVISSRYSLANGSDRDRFEITFNRPVVRKSLTKNITPSVAGLWIFEDPIYDTHLYRKIVFYPYSRLVPGREYKIEISGIANFLNNNSSSYAYSFRTQDVYDVLGESTQGNKFSVIGSFPQDGWDGINTDSTIRIRFSHPVDKNSAESHFSLLPEVAGSFLWESETMIFKPSSSLEYATKYSIIESEGVNILNGTFLTQKYTASFTTQNEITKLEVPSFLQKYTLSCEIAALRMVLSYRGITVDEDALLQKIGFDPNGKNGNVWGNPYVGFVGNIKGKQMVNGYGVYWEPIARAANNYRYSKSFENWTINNLTESIQKSTPVIVWISIAGRQPTIWLTPTGDRIKAVSDEHAVVVTGFSGPPNNPTQIIVNDPLIGEAFWSRESFEKKWASFSNSGVLVF